MGPEKGAAEPAGLKRSYRRGRKALREACQAPRPEAFHEWRKRVKYHRDHCRLIRLAWEGPLDARRKESHRLTDLLGEHHDLAELHQLLLSRPGSFGGREAVRVALERAGERRAALELEAFRLGRKLYAEAPKRLARRFQTFWRLASR
ncbi:MAG: CHAD domain-containing protein [Bryobacterales bacterium]